jgi:hypothetical protein
MDALDRWTFSIKRVVETFTLLSTLPTLCRTFVAISAMPARREASMSCRCFRSISSSASFKAVKTLEMPKAPTTAPSLTVEEDEIDGQIVNQGAPEVVFQPGE